MPFKFEEISYVKEFRDVYQEYLFTNKFNNIYKLDKNIYEGIKKLIINKNPLLFTMFNNSPLNLVPLPKDYTLTYPTASYAKTEKVKKILNNVDPITNQRLNNNLKYEARDLTYFTYLQPISRFISNNNNTSKLLFVSSNGSFLSSQYKITDNTIVTTTDYKHNGKLWDNHSDQYTLLVSDIFYMQTFDELTYEKLLQVYHEETINPSQLPYLYMNSHFSSDNLSKYDKKNIHPSFFRITPLIRISMLNEKYKCWIFKLLKKIKLLNFELNVVTNFEGSPNHQQYISDIEKKKMKYYDYTKIFADNKFNDLGKAPMTMIHNDFNACIFNNKNINERLYCEHDVLPHKYRSRNYLREILFKNRLIKTRKFYLPNYKNDSFKNIYVPDSFINKFTQFGSYEKSIGDIDLYFMSNINEFEGFLNADFSNPLEISMDIALTNPSKFVKIEKIENDICFNNIYSSNPNLEWHMESKSKIKDYAVSINLKYIGIINGIYHLESDLKLNDLLEVVTKHQNSEPILIEINSKYVSINDDTTDYDRLFIQVSMQFENFVIIKNKNYEYVFDYNSISIPNYYYLYFDPVQNNSSYVQLLQNNLVTLTVFIELYKINNIFNDKQKKFIRRMFRNVMLHYTTKVQNIELNLFNMNKVYQLAKTQLNNLALNDLNLKSRIEKIK